MLDKMEQIAKVVLPGRLFSLCLIVLRLNPM